MTEQLNTQPGRRSSVRRKALVGTALALVLGGGVVAGTMLPAIEAASAQPVTIATPVAIPSFADIVDQVAPAVVGIISRGEAPAQQDIPGLDQLPQGGGPLERFFNGSPFGGDQPQQQQDVPTTSIGSGFFISQDGYIVTNNHVVNGSDSFTVIMNDGTQYTAHLIGTDPVTDLALLKVDENRDFTYVQFADGQPRVGDWALAVGTPFGLGNTVTAGIVSAEGRQLSNNAYDDYIQIDAAVNQGNSGGPTFNLSGQVIGVNTAIYSPTGGNVGIAFDIPATTAAGIIQQLKDNGSVSRGWLGIQIQTVTQDIADALGLPAAGGALVAQPIDGGPAADVLHARDVITQVNGEAVADSTDLARKIGALQPGAEVHLTVIRDGQTTDVTVTLGTMPPDQGADTDTGNGGNNQQQQQGATSLGMAVTVDQNGVVIAQLDPNGTAAQAGLQQGDYIVAVGNTTVQSAQDVRDAVNAARTAGRPSVLFQISRNGNTAFVAVPVSTTTGAAPAGNAPAGETPK